MATQDALRHAAQAARCERVKSEVSSYVRPKRMREIEARNEALYGAHHLDGNATCDWRAHDGDYADSHTSEESHGSWRDGEGDALDPRAPRSLD